MNSINYIINDLISKGIMPKQLKTKDVVKLLNNKKYNPKALRQKDEFVETLGRKRVGLRKTVFVYDTIKVIELKTKII